MTTFHCWVMAMNDTDADFIDFTRESDPPVTWYLTDNINVPDSKLQDWERMFGIHENGTIFVPVVISLDNSPDFNIRACLYVEGQPYIIDSERHIYVPIDYARKKAAMLVYERRRVLNRMLDCIETLASDLVDKKATHKSNPLQYH